MNEDKAKAETETETALHQTAAEDGKEAMPKHEIAGAQGTNEQTGDANAQQEGAMKEEIEKEPLKHHPAGITRETVPEIEGKPDRKKRKNHPFLKGILAGVLLTAVSFVIWRGYLDLPLPYGRTLTVFFPAYALRNPDTEGRTALNYDAVQRKLKEIDRYLDSAYYKKDAGEIEDGIFRGMLYGLYKEDKYAEYYSPKEYKSLVESMAGNYQGIGAVVTQNPETLEMKVVEVYPDSPAEEAGLLADDIILAVDGENVEGQSLSDVVDEKVRGPEGTKVVLTVRRGTDEVDVSCTRRKLDITSVNASMLEAQGVGYISISSFEQNTVEQFEAAVDKLTKEGAKGFVIDLRDDGGGDMKAALKMLDYVLPDDLAVPKANGDAAGETENAQTAQNTESTKTEAQQGKTEQKTLLLYTEDKNGNRNSHYASDGHGMTQPIVLLTNGNTASSSEIFAGALRVYGAKTVGTKTYGKGIVQGIYPLQDNAAIKFTIEEYFLPDGTALHGKGIEPDVLCEPDANLKETGASAENPNPKADNQLAAALELLLAF